MTGPAAGDGTDRLLATLDDLTAAGRTVGLWWRDDDLERPTPALDTLLEALGEHGIAPALAAVAGRVDAQAVAALAGSPARVFVHGWTHANHAAAGARKSEFGPEREAGTRLAEIAEARRRLAAIAGERALACFVPPWNRIGDDLLARLGETGIVALSGFAPAGRPAPAAGVPRLDTHVDLIDWRGDRLPLTATAAAAALAIRIRSRLSAENHDSPVDGPLGILSHHRVTEAAAWRAWRPLLAALGGHPAVRWLDPAAALAAVGAAAGPPERALSAPGPGPGNETRRMG